MRPGQSAQSPPPGQKCCLGHGDQAMLPPLHGGLGASFMQEWGSCRHCEALGKSQDLGWKCFPALSPFAAITARLRGPLPVNRARVAGDPAQAAAEVTVSCSSCRGADGQAGTDAHMALRDEHVRTVENWAHGRVREVGLSLTNCSHVSVPLCTRASAQQLPSHSTAMGTEEAERGPSLHQGGSGSDRTQPSLALPEEVTPTPAQGSPHPTGTATP